MMTMPASSVSRIDAGSAEIGRYRPEFYEDFHPGHPDDTEGVMDAWLDTYDFQARPFYERHGYEMFAELDDLPGGHRRWFMRKRLAASAGRP